MIWILIFTLNVLISAFAQILLKIGAARAGKKSIFFQWQSLLGYTIYVTVVGVTMFLYKYINLSAGAVLETLGYVFVLILARIILGDRLTKRQYAGIGFILAGVVMAVF